MSAGIVERTLAILKPDGEAHEDKITFLVKQCGLQILARRKLQLTSEQAEDFYMNVANEPNYDGIIQFMTSGPIVALVIAGFEAIKKWRNLLGATDSRVAKKTNPNRYLRADTQNVPILTFRVWTIQSIRAQFGTDSIKNACHGSTTTEDAEREIRFFFPNITTDKLPTEEQIQEKLEGVLYPVLTKGLTELCKKKPENPIEWLGQWLLENNPSKPVIEEPEL